MTTNTQPHAQVIEQARQRLEQTLDRCAPSCWREWQSECDLNHHAPTIQDVWQALQILKRGS